MKTYTQEQKELLIAQKEKELAKLAKKELKPIVGRYLIVLLIMVTLNFCIDIFTMVTGLCNSVSGAVLSNVPAIFSTDLSYTFMVGCDLLMLASVLFVAFTVKETKNNDLDTITGDEY